MNSIIPRPKHSENRLLLDRGETELYARQSFSARLRNSFERAFSRRFALHRRVIKIDAAPYPGFLSERSNMIDNTKYSAFNFVFLFLYYEFSQFSNLYYLLLSASQFFRPLQVGTLTRLQSIIHFTISNHPLFQTGRGDRATGQNPRPRQTHQ